MSERSEFDPDAFSLKVIIKGQKSFEVEIPIMHEVVTMDGPDLKIEKATKTTQWAIDEYTTQFKDEEELLDDIKANNRVNLDGVSNEDISIKMFYNGYDHNAICTKIAYSDSFDLINLMNKSEFNDGNGMLYGENAEMFSENFKRYMIEKACVHKEAYEYWKYMIKNQDDCFYDGRLLMGLLRKHDEKSYEQGEYHLENREYEDEFCKYYNIRAHCLLNQDDFNAKLHFERLNNNGHPTSFEESLDLKEAKAEVRYHHPKRAIDEIEREYLGDKYLEGSKKRDSIIYDKGEFSQVPEEEMERYNHYYDDKPTEPIYEDYENEEKPHVSVMYFDEYDQGILPLEDVSDKSREVIYYDENDQTLLFDPNEYKKR